MANFKVTRDAARGLLQALGFSLADKFNATRCQNKLESIDEIADDDAKAKLEGGSPEAKLLDQLLKAKKRGDDIVVISKSEDAPEEEADEEKPKKKGRKAKPVEKEEADKGEDKPKKKGFEKVGVISTICETLKEATSKEPVTKDEVLKILVKKFPDRRSDALKSTINHQIPSYLRKAGHDVQKNDRGYWIAKKK